MILEQARVYEHEDSLSSIKAREHLKLTRFIQREWRHEFLSMNAVQSIVAEMREAMASSYHHHLDELIQFYADGLEHPKHSRAFDAFYDRAMKIQKDYRIDHPLHEWINVTMNGFLNGLLDEMRWTNESSSFINPLTDSSALMQWLNHLSTHQDAVRTLLAQQIEQTLSFDEAAWRCQCILNVLETLQPNQEYIRGTGMQKLLRLICQNKQAIITSTGKEEAKKVPIAALCRYSLTMQHALNRVKAKIPSDDFVRSVDVKQTPLYSHMT